MVLASQFNSFLQPFYIMLAVPLGIVGGIAALSLSGSSLNIYSGIGLVLLIGLVAKNSILLVDLTNQRREQGMSVDDALRDACPTRMRPVVMTSLMTTSTLLTLLVVPAGYSLVENWRERRRPRPATSAGALQSPHAPRKDD